MKNWLFAVALTTMSFVSGYGQKIAEDKIDEFTKNSVKRTSWETMSASKFGAHCRFSKINNSEFLDLKLMTGGVFGISEGKELMIKLSNDTIVTLKNLKSQITCRGCGAIGFSGSAAEGIEVSYVLNQDQAKMLMQNKISKVRIYINDGYIENEVKEKHSESIQNALKLIN